VARRGVDASGGLMMLPLGDNVFWVTIFRSGSAGPVALGELRALRSEGGQVGLGHRLQEVCFLNTGSADDFAQL